MSGPYADSARAMAEEFTEKTGYEVEVNDVPFASFHETAMLDFASQAGSYDVVAVNLSWLGEFAPHLEPLDSYVEASDIDTETLFTVCWRPAAGMEFCMVFQKRLPLI